MNSISNNSASTGICTRWNTIPVPNEKAAENWIKSGLDVLIATYFIPVTIVIAGIGNLAFIFMVARLNRMQTITNFYLVNIAIADVILGVIVPTLFVYSFFSSPLNFDVPYPTNGAFCYIAYMLAYFGYLLSVGIMTLVSFERYLAVCKPLLHMSMQSKGRAIKMTSAVWIVAAVTAANMALGNGKIHLFCLAWPDDDTYQNLPTHLRTCQPIIDVFVLINRLIEIGTLVIAISVNVVLYGFIVFALSTRSVTSATQSAVQDQATKIRNQVARTLVINGIIFFITQIPLRVTSLNAVFEQTTGTTFLTKGQADTGDVIGRTGLYLNSTINSFIYAFSSEFYRNGFIEAFSLFPKKKGGNNSSAESKTLSVSVI